MNKKHYFLDDKLFLEKELLPPDWETNPESMGDLSLTEFCTKHKCKLGSLRWAIRNWPLEKRIRIKQERRFHSNKR